MRKLEDDSPTDQPIADPRDVADTRLGTPVRDAAVDPQPGDFLPPTNAGEANPHGGDVVAPGIHGLETKAVVPGDVADTDRQQDRESELAERTLAGDEPVPEVVASLAEGVTDSLSQTRDAAVQRPQKNDSTAAWRDYAVASGAMSRDKADELGRDAIIARIDGT